jgi:hypothetical protein
MWVALNSSLAFSVKDLDFLMLKGVLWVVIFP